MVGCCLKNSILCGLFFYSFCLEFRVDYFNLYLLYDLIYGCVKEGESCCGGIICFVGFKCCDVWFMIDGGLGLIRVDGEDFGFGYLMDLYLRFGLFFDLLINVILLERWFLMGIFDFCEYCCLEYLFCC